MSSPVGVWIEISLLLKARKPLPVCYIVNISYSGTEAETPPPCVAQQRAVHYCPASYADS